MTLLLAPCKNRIRRGGGGRQFLGVPSPQGAAPNLKNLAGEVPMRDGQWPEVLTAFSAGMLIGALAVGWWQEARIRREVLAQADHAYQRLVSDYIVIAEALKLAVPNRVERAAFGAEAVRSRQTKMPVGAKK